MRVEAEELERDSHKITCACEPLTEPSCAAGVRGPWYEAHLSREATLEEPMSSRGEGDSLHSSAPWSPISGPSMDYWVASSVNGRHFSQLS